MQPTTKDGNPQRSRDRGVVAGSSLATFQQDQRKTGEMYTVSTRSATSSPGQVEYSVVGDKDVTMIERVIIDVDSAEVTRLKMPPDQHRSTLCDNLVCQAGWEDVQWASDTKTLAFVFTSRDHKVETVGDCGSGSLVQFATCLQRPYRPSGKRL